MSTGWNTFNWWPSLGHMVIQTDSVGMAWLIFAAQLVHLKASLDGFQLSPSKKERESVLPCEAMTQSQVFSSDIWWQQWKNNCTVSTNFLAWKNIFSNFWFQEMSLKREIFVTFLPQKFVTKYGIVSRYSVTFCFRKFWRVSTVEAPLEESWSVLSSYTSKDKIWDCILFFWIWNAAIMPDMSKMEERWVFFFRRHKGQSKTRCHPKYMMRLLINGWGSNMWVSAICARRQNIDSKTHFFKRYKRSLITSELGEIQWYFREKMCSLYTKG